MAINKERAKVLLEYFRKWDFQIFELMPIAEEDAKYILYVLEMYEHEKERKREYTSEYRKAQTFIRGGNNEVQP